ncbi:hypothetical protein ZIOFF_016047 [Zingiber officinale]|uniref:Uncharacterized protein n=1 Tax=Zingiber officinale TaxID=94328 RepID=A0A8J5I264_ZINOF|nr:hypothetical protein ZIOFF_016047 [Zingiber officinale]
MPQFYILLLSVILNFCRHIRGEDTAVHHIQWTTSLNNIEQTRYQLAIPWRNKTAWTTGSIWRKHAFHVERADLHLSWRIENWDCGKNWPWKVHSNASTLPLAENGENWSVASASFSVWVGRS